jgi:hypothetical protein
MYATRWLAVVGLLAVTGTAPAHAAPLGQDAAEARQAEPAAEIFPAWLPAGGLYGRHKWVPGSNGVDVFLPMGTEIRAPVAGRVVSASEMVHPQPPPVPSVTLRGDGDLSFFMGHVRPAVAPGTHVQACDLLAVIDDPMLDQMGTRGPGPGGWQHVDLNVSRHGSFTWYGGDVAASAWLQGTGYDGTLVEQTPGPTGR